MIVIGVLLSLLPVQFQQPSKSSPATPEGVVTAYYSSFKQLDWHGCTKLMSPAGLESLKKAFLIIARKPDAKPMILDMFKKKSISEVESLSGAEIAEGVLSAILPKNGPNAPLMKQMTVEPLGHVMEGQTAHVVVRMGMPSGGSKRTNMIVQSVDKVGNQWLLPVPSDLKNGLNLLGSPPPNR
jgi:hypothetical protein